jgi:hypothetical protein
MKSNHKKIIFLCLFLAVFVIGSQALASDLGFDYANNLGLANSEVTDPRDLIVNIVKFALSFVGLIAVVFMMYGGFLWMTSNGDPDRVNKAKKTLISAGIGLAIIISAFVIVNLVMTGTGAIISGGCSDGDTKSCGCGGTQACSGGFWGACVGSDCGLTPSALTFRVRRSIPKDQAMVARNVTVAAIFNQIIGTTDQVTLNDNFTFSKIATIDPDTFAETAIAEESFADVTAVVTSEDKFRLTRQSTKECGDEKDTPNCFDAWTKYRVRINSGLGDIENTSGTAALDFSFEFSVNNSVDTMPPVAGIMPAQICHDDGTLTADANYIGAWGRDDVGIGAVRFYEQGNPTPIASFIGNSQKYQFEEYQVDTAAMAAGDSFASRVEVDDMVPDTASSSFTATVRQGHCCNGILDVDEEETDCGGSDCESCSLQNPVISWVSPDNGAPGNFVTIGGRHFGTTTGAVYFWNGVDYTALAAYPDSVNASCIKNWSDNQIIVVVPAAASSGPIRIFRNDGRDDATDDDYGPAVPDFIINSTARPGLCLLAPDNGMYRAGFSLQGNAFSGSGQAVFFGNETENLEAPHSNLTNTSASSSVPNAAASRTTVFFAANGQSSNLLYFNIIKDLKNIPIIDYVDPGSGPSGQYVTVNGSGFGPFVSGTSMVTFTYIADGTQHQIGTGASFPKECQDKWWSNRQIIVKAPEVGGSLGNYRITVTNRSSLTSDPKDFEITSGIPGPGICLLDPDNGKTGISVNVFGDNFGALPGSGFVQFFAPSLINVSTGLTWANQNIKVNVPASAQTGPVKVSNGTDLSNGLQFRVGACATSTDCDFIGGEECCLGGTFWSGTCRTAGTCGAGTIAKTGYGWSFTVSSSSSALACGGFSDRASCDAAGRCPNSPGECQTNDSLNLDKNCSTADCNDRFAQCRKDLGGLCVYDAASNLCAADSAPLAISCDQTSTTLIPSYTAVCRNVNSNSVWQINEPLLCPTGSYLDINGWCTVGAIGNPTECDVCGGGFLCNDNKCVVNQRICPINSTCTGGLCVLSNAVCECCCDVAQSARDCCAGLTCEAGGCGNDPVNYGLCSGCRVDLNGNNADLTADEQTASDDACNCDGTNGKYCEIADPADSSDLGVCQDAKPCDISPVPGCQADSASCDTGEFCDTDCFCKKGKPCDNDLDSSVCGAPGNCDPATEHCDTDDCFCQPGKSCDNDLDPTVCGAPGNCDATEYCDTNCVCQKSEVPVGDPCFQNSSSTLPACNPFHCGSAYECLTDNYESVASACGYCCCDLDDANTPDDACLNLNPNLYCAATADTGSACFDSDTSASPNFGICCGCATDAECGGSDGCGTDACCHGRPDVESVYPSDMPAASAGTVCRNTSVEVTFNQLMDIESFPENIIMVGDHGISTCPQGTSYLAVNGEKEKSYNAFKRLAFNIFEFSKKMLAPILREKEASAFTPVSSTHNFCAVKGSVSSYTEDGKSVLTFSPNSLLDPSRLYYVIVKGDKDLNSLTGVENEWGIGMNPLGSPSAGDNTFNKITYGNSYIWSFTTLSDQGSNHGVCKVDHIKVDPASYLFKTTKNDLSEADNADSAADSDKIFIAKAKTSDNQTVVPMSDYAWDYGWSVLNGNIAQIVSVSDFAATGSLQLVRTQNNITDGRTVVRATAASTVVPSGMPPFSLTGDADIYVFVCQNPWPPVIDGLWAPWRDNSSNCSGGATGCNNTNYEIYYCRDAGGSGTFDDLPAIVSSSTLNLRQTLICSEGGAPCAVQGAACGTTGTCEISVLKESFFFRAAVPDVSAITLAGSPDDAGGIANLHWNDIPVAAIPVGESLNAYKIYYGTASGKYAESLTASILDPHTASTPFAVGNLKNNQKYYFSITAVFASGAESAYSNEIILTPADKNAPLAPGNLTATPTSTQAELSWDAVSGASSYVVYYGAISAIYGSSQNIGAETEVIITGLINGQTYYFAITAKDKNGNESPYSNEVAATPASL